MDSEDKCPKKAGSKEGEGCPDSDGDGLYDHLDKCPFSAGDKDNNGCPKDDKDRDGIADTDDKCPDVPGLKEFAGCPDSDKDGIQDSEDKCPLKPGTKEGEGCPDSDGDGVFDHLDVCPAIPGVAANKGCPEIKEEVKEQIRLAAKGIYFESGNDVIKAESFVNLDKLATIMNEYKEAKVMIEGHTDSQGADAANTTLSQKRADAVKMYIASKGVTESRMTAIGYGETKPVADNGSAEGRALNRRVDFKLVY
jgi:outer membrane protein OmpA-like peptidoglycan-associated protein